MFRPQSKTVELDDGTEIYLYNSPGGWHIRYRDLAPRISGIADLGRLGHRADGRAQMTDVGLRMSPSQPDLPKDWEGRTFGSAEDAERFVRQSVATHPRWRL